MVEEMLAGDELAPDDPATAPRHRVPRPQLGHLQPERLARQHRRAHRPRLPRRDDPVRPLPRPQVRPGLAGRLLPAPRLLRAAPHPDRPRAGPARPHQGGPAAGLRRLPGDPDVPVRPRRRGHPRQDAAAPARDSRVLGGEIKVVPVSLSPTRRLSRQARVRRSARPWRRPRRRSRRPVPPSMRHGSGPSRRTRHSPPRPRPTARPQAKSMPPPTSRRSSSRRRPRPPGRSRRWPAPIGPPAMPRTTCDLANVGPGPGRGETVAP